MKKLALAIIAALSLAACVPGINQNAALEAGGPGIFQLAQPAVVRIFHEASATISYPSLIFDQAELAALINQLDRRFQTGEFASRDEMILAFVDAITAEPLRFFIPGDQAITQEAVAASSGSGFVVTSDGYVVTNAHVAAPTEEELATTLIQNGMRQIIDADVKDFVDTIGIAVPQEYLDKIAQADQTYILEYGNLSEIQRTITVALVRPDEEQATFGEAVPAVLEAAGESTPGKDVAVLKIETEEPLITLPLGDDTALEVGDEIYVAGFPGAATDNPLLGEGAALEPSFTDGVMSARKPAASGDFDVIQTDAAITHGNSGGPALNDRGEVIGLATFISLDEGGQIQGFNFLMPTALINEFLAEASVTPDEGPITPIWETAINAGVENRFSEQLEELRKVEQQAPNTPFLERKITLAEAAVAAGQDEKPSAPVALYALIGAGVLVLLFVMFMMMRRRSRPAMQAATMPATAMPSAAPPPPPPPAPPVEEPTLTPPPPLAAPVDPDDEDNMGTL